MKQWRGKTSRISLNQRWCGLREEGKSTREGYRRGGILRRGPRSEIDFVYGPCVQPILSPVVFYSVIVGDEAESGREREAEGPRYKKRSRVRGWKGSAECLSGLGRTKRLYYVSTLIFLDVSAGSDGTSSSRPASRDEKLFLPAMGNSWIWIPRSRAGEEFKTREHTGYRIKMITIPGAIFNKALIYATSTALLLTFMCTLFSQEYFLKSNGDVSPDYSWLLRKSCLRYNI